jgi:2-polyprenyl-6-methoxyphenol hydroxylase-like FAD-dependent oxidoreductase
VEGVSCSIKKMEQKDNEGTLLSETNGPSSFKKEFGWSMAGVKRFTLQTLLMDAVKDQGIPLHFSKSLSRLEQNEDGEHDNVSLT